MNFDWFQLHVIIEYYPMILEGLYTTIKYTFIALITSIGFGLIVSLIHTLRLPIISKLINGYIAIGRETPLLVQLYFVFYALPELGIVLQAWQAGILAITFNEGAFIAEIVRGGVQSIGKGQWEAARSLAMTRLEILRFIIFPQAIRKVMPSLIGHSSYILKDTAMLSLITIEELTNVAHYINYFSLSSFTTFTVIACLYIILFWILNGFGVILQNRMPKGE